MISQSLRSTSATWPVLVVLVYCCGLHAGPSYGQPPRSLSEARAFGRERSTFLKAVPPQSIDAPEPNLSEFTATIQPILAQACTGCHGEDTQEGNVRIDTLNPDLVHGNDIDWWLEVQAVLSNGEMPPPDEGELGDGDRAKVIEWLSAEIQLASIARRASGDHSSFRRLTRYEFNYALQDLLGLPYDFARDLPPEAHSEDGFQNSSELLHMSVSQLETYRRLARKALLRATVHGPRPETIHWGVTMQDAGRIDWARQDDQWNQAKAEKEEDADKKKKRLEELEKEFSQPHPVPYFKNRKTGRTVRASWNYRRAQHANPPSESPKEIPESPDCVAILPRQVNGQFTIELGNRVPDEGTLRVRVRAAKVDAGTADPPTLQLLFGWQASNEGRAVLPLPDGQRVITAGPDAPEFYEWDVPLGEIYPRNSVRKTSPMGSMPNPSEYIRLVNCSHSQGPIQIDYVEVATPVYDQWPPASHTRIFFDSPNRDNESVYAREVITAFMRRAWCRPLADDEVDQKLRLFAAMRPTCDTFEETIVEVLATVLASPSFLYVGPDDSEQRALDAHELAARLAMFLWSSVPDDELRRHADDATLLEPEILGAQVERMLADERAGRFAEHFVHQWLDLQLLEFRNLPRGLRSLKEAMQREPIALFGEMLRTDASVLDFVHADYTMANERLAMHYGLRDVKGNHFRRVPLEARNRRGGLLTQAGLLTMNAAGEDSHPLKRGIWLLESLLNDPPPPPPPAVPEIDLADPEIAKMTLKERIEDHRNHAACMSCHSKIDPWGIAFENYGPLGQWRDRIKGKPVDASSELFNHETLAGMDGLKRFLLENRQDQFVRALVHRLATYALGRPLAFSDRSEVDHVTSEVRRQGDSLATLVRSLVMSDLFRSK